MSNIEYYNEDCMAGMARYPDKYFDLANERIQKAIQNKATSEKGL